MKKSVILGAIITSFVLSACSLFKTYSSESKEVGVYLLDYAVEGNKSIENCKLGKISPEFIDGEGYVPYFSLEQYASLYKPYFKSDVKSEVENDTMSSTWTIYRGDELYFYAVISPITKTITTAGSIYNVLATDSNPADYSVISKNTKFEDSYERLSDKNYATYSFSGYSFKSFSKNSRRYFPLGLLDNAFSESSNIFHFYNYKNIYATWDVENYSKKFKTSSLSYEISVDTEMENITKGQSIPSYLLDYNLSCFLFVMDNFYGLKSYYKINSMKEYFSKYQFYSDINSMNGYKRGVAYSSCLAVLDDHHTGLVSANNAWGEGQVKAIGGENVIKRQYQNEELTKLRKETMGADRTWTISSDRKTVLFHFDSFDLGTTDQVFNEDGSVKTSAWKYDSFYNVLGYLKTFEAEGNVKNVIIDVSTNGGGVIGVMAKILALISKDNKGIVSMMDQTTGLVDTTVCSVDVNMDGKYTADEVYGNKFNFYILCSDCSFSCGNAFPCCAQKMGIKVLGEKSGGGECAVGVHYMPNSEYVYHSSMTHLGYFDQANKKFTGFESGATPDISLLQVGKTSFSEYKGEYIDYNIPNNLYDVNALSAKIA